MLEMRFENSNHLPSLCSLPTSHTIPVLYFYSYNLRLDVPFSVYASKENSCVGNAILAEKVLTPEDVVVVFPKH